MLLQWHEYQFVCSNEWLKHKFPVRSFLSTQKEQVFPNYKQGLILRLIKKTKRGQAVPSLNLCLKKVFNGSQRLFLAKKKKILAPRVRGPSVFNSRLLLWRTELASHSHQALCPGSYPPKWQDVWHTFLFAKGVDSCTWGSKMTKIEPPPKCPGTQALSYLCFFQLTMERKSVKNALPFINYSVMQSTFFFINAVWG